MTMTTPKFYGAKKNGKFVFEDRPSYELYLENFKEDTPLELTVKRKYKRRTSGQPGEETNFNGYYWAVIVSMVADEIGEADRQAVHGWIQMATGNVKRMPDGKEVPGNTHDMSGGEFSDMCVRARNWAATPGNLCEYGLNLPEPGE